MEQFAVINTGKGKGRSNNMTYNQLVHPGPGSAGAAIAVFEMCHAPLLP